MKNEKVMAIVLMEIDIISNEQMKLVKYNEELEDRRLRVHPKGWTFGNNFWSKGQSYQECQRNEVECVKIWNC